MNGPSDSRRLPSEGGPAPERAADALEPPRWTLAPWALGFGTLSMVASAVAAVLLTPLTGERGVPELEKAARENFALFLFAIVVVAPALETLVGQWLPTWLVGLVAGRGRASVLPRVVGSALLFAALHLGNSATSALVMLVATGPVLAYTFVRWRAVSRTHAYVATTLTHAVHNGWAGLIVALAL